MSGGSGVAPWLLGYNLGLSGRRLNGGMVPTHGHRCWVDRTQARRTTPDLTREWRQSSLRRDTVGAGSGAGPADHFRRTVTVDELFAVTMSGVVDVTLAVLVIDPLSRSTTALSVMVAC